jgi:tRNA(fMet)-specific endonuclease VapC
MILDSDFLIDLLRNDLISIKKIKSLKSLNEPLIITSINSFELFKGVLKNSKMNSEQLNLFVNNFRILDFDRASSEKAAEIFNILKAKGEMIELTDIMIASITIVNNESLLTRNKKHYERIPGLKIEAI